MSSLVCGVLLVGHGGRDRRKPGGDKAPEYVGFDGFDDTRGEEGATGKAEAMCGVSRKDNVWIMKPVGMSRGRGIRLINDIKNITYADKVGSALIGRGGAATK